MKKILSVLLSVPVVLSAFAGCTAGSGSPAASQSPSAAAPSASGKEEAPSQSGQPVTLRYGCWDYDVESGGAGHKELAEAFMKEYPNIKIEPFSAPPTDADYNDKIAIMLASGETLDVFYCRSIDMYGSVLLKNQAMALDELIARDSLDITPYSGMVESLKYDDKIYALPQRANYWLLFYNKDIFDANGRPYPSNHMTWAEFEETAKTLTSGEGAERIYGAHWDTISTYAAFQVPALQKEMGDIVTGDLEMFREPLEMYRRMLLEDKTAVDYATNVSTSVQWRGAFAKGNVAMMPIGSYFLNQCISDIRAGSSQVNWGVAHLPTWDGGEYINATTPTPTVINANTKYPEEAWTFVKFLTGEKGSSILASLKMFPAYSSEAVTEAFKTDEAITDEVASALGGIDKMYLEFPVNTLSGLVSDMIGQEVVLCLTGNCTVDACIQTMTQRREEIAQEYSE